MGLIVPLLADSVMGIDEIFLATTEDQPNINPQFAVLTIFEEATFDLLARGLATTELYNVRLNSVRLDPNATLVCIPDSFIATEYDNTGTIVQTLRGNGSIF